MEKREPLTARALLEIGGAFQTSRPLLTAVELDLFTRLGDARLTASELARAMGVDERALSYLLDALAAQRLLEKVSGGYQNTAEGRTLLVRGAPGSILAVLEHYANLWVRWATLTEVVRAGHPVARREEGGAGSLESFLGAMHALAQESAPQVAEAIGLKGVRRMLDVGGGAASYSIAFAQAEPGLTAVVFDLPDVVPIARRNIEAAGLQERITTQAGNYHEDAFETGFDLVLLSAIVHSNSQQENAALVRKCFDALAPGGRLVIRDFIMSPDRTEPAPGALFAINMLVNTPGGGTFTEAEMRSWLDAAGFTDTRRVDLPGMNALMIGTRKA